MSRDVKDFCFSDVMKRIQSAEVTMLDRWKVDLKQSNWRFGESVCQQLREFWAAVVAQR